MVESINYTAPLIQAETPAVGWCTKSGYVPPPVTFIPINFSIPIRLP